MKVSIITMFIIIIKLTLFSLKILKRNPDSYTTVIEKMVN